MRKLALFVTIPVLWLAGGCSTAPKAGSPETQAADYGEPLAPGYEDKVKNFLAFYFKDSASAQYQFAQPYRSFFHKQGVLAGKNKGTIYGYTVPVLINAKNAFGAYTGFRPYKFFFRDNAVTGWSDENGIWWDLRS